MAEWYHVETTLDTGVVWRTSQPLSSWVAVQAWITRETGLGVVKVEIKRYSDEPPHPGVAHD